MNDVRLNKLSRVAIGFFALWVLLWSIGVLVVRNPYADSYWWVSYKYGFYRRGLAGEILLMWSPQERPTGVRILGAACMIAFVVALVALTRHLRRSELPASRKLAGSMALFLAPCMFVFALTSSRPDLLGAALLVMFALALWNGTPRNQITAAVIYALVTVFLTFIHEAITLEFSIGAVLAILLATRAATAKFRSMILIVSIVPSAIAAGIVLLASPAGHRTAEYCSVLPDFRSGAFNVWSYDYKDFICTNAFKYFDYSLGKTVHHALNRGIIGLFFSTVIGIVMFVLCMAFVRYLIGVPFSRFAPAKWNLRGFPAVPAIAAGLVMFVALFFITVDWTRWWGTFAMNLLIVYAVFAIDPPGTKTPVLEEDKASNVRPIISRWPFVLVIVMCFLPPFPAAV